MAAMIKLVLLDNDGTLSDSVPRCQQATNYALAEAGFPGVSTAETAEGMRLETVLRMMSHAGSEDTDLGRRLGASYHRYSSPLVDETLLFPGIQEMLQSLSAAGYAMGIVSNNLSNTVERVLRANNVISHFPVIVGEDNAEETKPRPEGLLQACRLCGFSVEETVYVGDGPSDALAARAAGIISVGVTWNTHDPADVGAMGFDYLIDSPGELKSLLGRLRLNSQ